MSTATPRSHDPADLRRRLKTVSAKSDETDKRVNVLLTDIEREVKQLSRPAWKRIFSRAK